MSLSSPVRHEPRGRSSGGDVVLRRLLRCFSTWESPAHRAACSSTRRVASSIDAPSARAASYIACACCASSSTTPSSAPPLLASAARTRVVQSFVLSMLSIASIPLCRPSAPGEPGDTIQAEKERFPDAALAREHLPARRGEPIVAAPTLPRLLDPAPLDQPLFFEPVQRRIERGDVKADCAP